MAWIDAEKGGAPAPIGMEGWAPCRKENRFATATSRRESWLAEKPVVRVKPRSYQPTRAELNEPPRIDAPSEEPALAALRPVRVIEDPDT